MTRSLYPAELRAVVQLLEGLDSIDEKADPKADTAVGLKSGTEVWHHEDGECLGTIVDPDGVGWSFLPATP